MDQIIFIMGVEHSGTTILYRMLARHPELAFFSQYSLRYGIINGRKTIPNFLEKYANRLTRKFFGVQWEKNVGAKKISPSPDESDIWNIVLPSDKFLYYKDDVNENLSLELERILHKELKNWNLKKFIAKKPYLSRYVYLLNEIFPNSKFVNILRDGKAVSISIKNKFHQKSELANNSLKEAARYWVKTSNYLRECDEELENFKTIKYEDYCSDVHGTIYDVLNFCGLQENILNFSGIPETLKVTNSKRYDLVNKKEKKELNSILESELIANNYPLFEV